MKKILFLGVNARYSHSNLALYYLREYIRDLDYTSRISEFTIKENAEKIYENVLNERPHILVVSVYIWNSEIIKEFLSLLENREHEKIEIILGGPEVSYNPDSWLMAFPAIDYIISGPGEESLRRIVHRDSAVSGKVVSFENPPFDDIPFPYIDDDISRLKNRIVYYESSRGCSFRCSYCLSSRIDQRTEFRSFERVCRELDLICGYGVKFLKFVDRTFNSDRDRAKRIWKYIMKNFSHSGMVFHFEVHPELLRDEDIDFLAEVPHGLFQFELGIQSVNRSVLKEINRNFDVHGAIEKVKRLCAPGNVHSHVDIIAGLPFDSLDDYVVSFNRVYNCGADHFQPGILKVLPGTEMYNKAESYGMEWSATAPYEVMKTEWITLEEMNLIKAVSAITELISNSGRFTHALNYLIELSGSPWDFFRKIQEESFAVTRYGRDWDSICLAILSFTGKFFKPDFEYMVDLLSLDWALTSRTSYFPLSLKEHLIGDAKKRGYRFFIEKSKNNQIKFGSIIFNSSDLKKALFFIPLTEKFRFHYGVSYGIAVLTSKETVTFPASEEQ